MINNKDNKDSLSTRKRKPVSWRDREKNSPFRELKIWRIRIWRISHQTEGGVRFRFSALVLIKDEEKNALAFAQAKGEDVTTAVKKSIKKAIKKLTTYFPITHYTIPYDIVTKFKATTILLKPAPPGTGILAGGVLYTICKYLGIENISTKVFGSRNKVNVTKCFFKALDKIAKSKKVNKG